jgi:uncharacterized protein YbjQ (UPF0145 family)
MPAKSVLVTTAPTLEGHHIVRSLGVVRGIVVRSVGFTRGITGAFRSMFAGNVHEYEDVCEKARSEAYARMVQHAEQLGANAIVAMRYDATEFMQGVSEVLCYGTAVTVAAD